MPLSHLCVIRILNILHIYCYEKTHILCNTSGVVTIKASFVLTDESYMSVLSFEIYFFC